MPVEVNTYIDVVEEATDYTRPVQLIKKQMKTLLESFYLLN